jgi:hypothetical protein
MLVTRTGRAANEEGCARLGQGGRAEVLNLAGRPGLCPSEVPMRGVGRV